MHGRDVCKVAANKLGAPSEIILGQAVLPRPFGLGLGEPGVRSGEHVDLGGAVQEELGAELAANASGAASHDCNLSGHVRHLGKGKVSGSHCSGHPQQGQRIGGGEVGDGVEDKRGHGDETGLPCGWWLCVLAVRRAAVMSRFRLHVQAPGSGGGGNRLPATCLLLNAMCPNARIVPRPCCSAHVSFLFLPVAHRACFDENAVACEPVLPDSSHDTLTFASQQPPTLSSSPSC